MCRQQQGSVWDPGAGRMDARGGNPPGEESGSRSQVGEQIAGRGQQKLIPFRFGRSLLGATTGFYGTSRDQKKIFSKTCEKVLDIRSRMWYSILTEGKVIRMTRTYKKAASYPHPTNYPHHNRHTNHRGLRKRMDRRDRRRLNRFAENFA